MKAPTPPIIQNTDLKEKLVMKQEKLMIPVATHVREVDNF